MSVAFLMLIEGTPCTEDLQGRYGTSETNGATFGVLLGDFILRMVIVFSAKGL